MPLWSQSQLWQRSVVLVVVDDAEDDRIEGGADESSSVGSGLRRRDDAVVAHQDVTTVMLDAEVDAKKIKKKGGCGEVEREDAAAFVSLSLFERVAWETSRRHQHHMLPGMGTRRRVGRHLHLHCFRRRGS